MKRRQRGGQPRIPLFTFLDVLICTMGALIVLLSLLIERTKQHVDTTVVEPVVAAQPVVDEEEQNRLQEREEDLQWQTELLQGQRDKYQEDLANKRAELTHFEDHIRRLEDEARNLMRQAEELEKSGKSKLADHDSAAQQLAEMEKEIDAKKKELEAARKEILRRRPAYAIVPYDGPNGTSRRPMYIECKEEGIVLQPEGVVLTAEDFQGPLGPGNPLDAALRASREHFHRNGLQGEPYPLIIVRPNGAIAFGACRSAMKHWESEFGYELVDQDAELKYPAPDPQLAVTMQRAIVDARQRQFALAAAMPNRFGGPQGRMTSFRTSDNVEGDDGGDEPGAGGGSGSGNQGGSGRGPGGRGGMAGSPSAAGQGRGSGGDQLAGSPSGNGFGQGGTGLGNGSAGATGVGGNGTQGVSSNIGGQGPRGQTGQPGQPGSGSNQQAGDPQAKGNSSSPGGNATRQPGQRGNRSNGSQAGNNVQGNGSGASYAGGTAGGGQSSGSAGQQQPGGTSSSSSGARSGSSGSPGSSGNSAGGGSSAGGDQSSGGTPSPTVNVSSPQLNKHSEKARKRIKQGGDNWGLPNASNKATAVTRPIRVECYAEQLKLMPERGDVRTPLVVPIEEDLSQNLDGFLDAVWRHMDRWGIAVSGGYWKPILTVDVKPGGEDRFAELQRLMRGSGIEVQRKTP